MNETFSCALRVLDHDLRGAEVLAPVDDHDLTGDLRQRHRLVHRRVAAADHRDALALEERSVAGDAVRDAIALERVLGRQPQRLAVAPVDTMTASASITTPASVSRNGHVSRSIAFTSFAISTVPKRSACCAWQPSARAR